MNVTADNFKRAETDMYFAMFVKRGTSDKFIHLRELPLEGTVSSMGWSRYDPGHRRQPDRLTPSV